MQKLALSEIQDIEMSILDEIENVCAKLGIHYFLAYGSLLGAARHEGFIPWDDDMDIFMMRADYEKLVDNFDRLTDDPRLRMRHYRDGVSNLSCARVVRTDTHVDMRFVKEKYAMGLWVDIFPLDFIPAEKPPLLLKEKAFFLARVFATSIPAPERPSWQNTLLKLTSLSFSRVDPVKLSAKLDQAAACHSATPSDYLCDISGEPEHPRCYKREWFEPAKLPFGDRVYSVPSSYENVLDVSYGDWQTLPPENKRVPHGTDAYLL